MVLLRIYSPFDVTAVIMLHLKTTKFSGGLVEYGDRQDCIKRHGARGK